MNTNIDQRYFNFRRFSLITLIAVYFLILVGGIVRSTGAGMGCPDWPKCFGDWVPPTDESQLPENYQEIYSMKRHEKNIKLASYLNFLGMSKTASRIIEDPSIKEEGKFNAVKTWTEYVNRLVGATIGVLVFLTAFFSMKLRKSDPPIFYFAILTLLLIGFQGWIGSVVVSTKLLPWMVTVHMILALIIVALLTYLWFKADQHKFVFRNSVFTWLLLLSMIALSIQITFGTQVREEIDLLGRDMINKQDWTSAVGFVFYFHRSFSLLILLINSWLLYKIYTAISRSNPDYLLSRMISILIIVEIATGAGMAYFSVPPFLQPIHLLIGTILFGLSFLLFLKLSTSEIPKVVAHE